MLDRKLLRDLWRVRGQVVTIALVVASGVAAFTASLSTWESLKRMQARSYEEARFAQVFARVRRAPDALVARLRAVDGVAEVEVTITVDALIDLPGVVEPMVGRLVGLPRDGRPTINRLTLVRGRWIDDPRGNEVLLHQTFAQRRGLGPGDTLQALLDGKREVLRVAGIVLSPEYVFTAAHGLGDETTFAVMWTGRERLAAAYDLDGAFNTVALRLARDAPVRPVIDALDRLLAPYGAAGAHARDEQPSHQAVSQEIAEQKVFGLVLPSVFLGVAVFLLQVVLTRQIGTQRAQIAALKALGVPEARIALHYLKFVLAIVLLGCALGIAAGAALGSLLVDLYTRFFHFPAPAYGLPGWIPLAATAVALAGATAGAAQALRRVMRLPPAEAMRPASPPVFRPALLERAGLGRLIAPAAKMVVRDLERRPARAAATTLGIAAAVAILVSGTWWRDAIEYLLEVEFRMRERQDVSVILAGPASSAARHDLARLPGVLQIEPFRVAAVRLVHGRHRERTALNGLSAPTVLRPLLDARLAPVPLPADGLLLNPTLARQLAVRPGDRVRVEFLEGARAVRELTVAGLVSDLMGAQAFIERGALNRLLAEGDAIGGARLRLDAAHRDAFLQAVKQTPQVAFAIEIGPILRNFRETSARNILIFTTVLSVLAGTIAVGVVYNNARIALAERAWELASLRVLGMSRAQVSGLLLGELALELLVALPLGWLAGYGLSAGMLALIETETFSIPLLIAPRTYAFAGAVVLLAGAASALIVRRQVDRLDLVAVLKSRE